ncbi:unnamed protein product [Arabis nemorensis]|uniref:Uncharacterized protein n=1 Tax=Arabis nemorensis TaxID=586526 RepID=A0A565C6B7_9BRAS|nr:unnamed protein product [Arabis nemorensis]
MLYQLLARLFDDYERFSPTLATVSSALLLGICGLTDTVFRAIVNVGGDLVNLVPGRDSTKLDARLACDTNIYIRNVHDLLRLKDYTKKLMYCTSGYYSRSLQPHK